MTVTERLTALRNQLKERGLSAWIVTSTDPHDSEYTPERWETRAYISGFNGSWGLVIITLQSAALWTDGRYFLQAEAELQGSGIELMREGHHDTPSPMDWLGGQLHRGAVVGTDALTAMHARLEAWRVELSASGVVLQAGEDLLDTFWQDRPKLPASVVTDYQGEVEGLVTRTEKLSHLRGSLVARGVGAHVVTTLDEVAWLLNLRGADIAYNPVFLGWVWVEADRCLLYTEASRLTEGVADTLKAQGIRVLPYQEIFEHSPIADSSLKVLVTPERTNEALYQALSSKLAPGHLVGAPSLLAKPKACKTSGELALIQKAHDKDAVALVEFLAWFDQTVSHGLSHETEQTISDKLVEFRRAQPGHRGESFAPIPGWKDNGAIIHFHLSPGKARAVNGRGLFLLDTGAQYLEGTTDVTRTLAVGTPTSAEIEDYTLVLKAHIQVALTPFLQGSRGYTVDAFARQVLWKAGRNYGHGTGHGVGQYLSVHEGPARINAEPVNVVLEAGMVMSNEPGLYRPGQYGIRLENLVVATPGQQTDFGRFLTWQTITHAPFDRRLIDPAALTNEERTWLNAYHAQVLERVGARVTPETRAWLAQACSPVDNSIV